ncbi:TetR/AcrR family transcriptional regulator [Mycolicibacterium diernhoferi]|uniref:TetR family transcriptional regulator n=1 Tax=Mycolicibacterium diernhoferi TaxID=1801 RepID=A0A1Q4H8U2_9MYCO|nr:TetR/AcrR family transcriptional regulator [Mycolicibacterium diernhoferi]OJZ63966.1 TetR family transcriptional regulator [Mycolicibacterium diernhoferi]OPE56007.1 TetR family transcriptional regulator [Mycolicibacterium diernhoferi]PEG55649.1 TetR/AcrR family transcriptional regulator [Mycolicibacterium diernhoferi]QYL20654.1 TetR/AcrR family transcriptional regulator [Mycolicibacterium diernhoferi]
MGKRQESRDRIEAQIIEVGRRHLVSDGAAGLSLRAIAREIGLVSSAVYRYVASRDDLLTLLLVDAYTELADTVDAAGAGVASGDWAERLLAMAHAARAWAIDQPARWALLYGSPVPGYRAPAESTVGPGTRVIAALFAAIGDGIRQGAVPDPEDAAPQPVSEDFGRIREEFDFAGGDPALLRCVLVWASLVGAISLEVFGQYGPDTLSAPGVVFDGQMRLLVQTLTSPAAGVWPHTGTN